MGECLFCNKETEKYIKVKGMMDLVKVNKQFFAAAKIMKKKSKITMNIQISMVKDL